MERNREDRSSQFICTVAVVASLCATSAAQSLSGAWARAGSHPSDYEMGIDRTSGFTGSASGYIRSAKANPQGFGTYMQTFDATEYRGRRLRLSAYVKSENVKNWAGLWMRIDRDKKPVAFDNMHNRPISDSHLWTLHTIVLDVDSQATAVAFGILLAGPGAVWIDDVMFDVVGADVPVTDLNVRPPARPRNLDFEAGADAK
jgi:hypothetical protein